MGYGPRFLHSTGQLHKVDGGGGLFLQITAYQPRDADIPDEAGSEESSLTFGVLVEAQALGDRQALLDAERRTVRLHLGGEATSELNRITNAI
jgi:glucose-6-phosphate isomerase/transaldolase/glucose-6-phosphate isomerase